jgi:hypothetical protein
MLTYINEKFRLLEFWAQLALGTKDKCVWCKPYPSFTAISFLHLPLLGWSVTLTDTHILDSGKIGTSDLAITSFSNSRFQGERLESLSISVIFHGSLWLVCPRMKSLQEPITVIWYMRFQMI